MLIIRTHRDNIPEVVRLSKHALDSKPNLTRGDLILISQNSEIGIRDSKPPIRYIMEFERIYLDTSGESKRIWGKKWTYILEGKNCRALKHPFDIRQHKVTDNNYGAGGPYIYVAPDDEKIIIQKGLLDTE